MISSERSQNIIVVFTIIAAVVSSGFLVSNVNYYTGSYALIGRMSVDIVTTRVSNIDPMNESVFPGIFLTVNMRTNAETEGNVRLKFLGADVTLNDDRLSYTTFAYTFPLNLQPVHPDYDRNITLRSSTNSVDRQTVFDAYNADTWHWYITLRYSFFIFDEPGTISFRFLTFNYTGATIT